MKPHAKKLQFARMFVQLLGLVVLMSHSTGLYAAPKAEAPGLELSASQISVVGQALTLIKAKHITPYAQTGLKLLKIHKIFAARPNDPWLKQAQSENTTPFAYTLSDPAHPHKPLGIVLAPIFFNQTTPNARAATLIHEIGHWLAYVHSGISDEYDGYKAEYDTHNQLGLNDHDGLTYFTMLDGVVQYVVPRDKRYAQFADVKQYISGG